MDLDCKRKLDDLQSLRDKHAALTEERRFLEEQTAAALDGKVKLQSKRDELAEELAALEAEGVANGGCLDGGREAREKERELRRMGKAEREAKQAHEYYEMMKKKMREYSGYLEKRNEA
jgi:hypothetical protein